jgi:hypothetical protein
MSFLLVLLGFLPAARDSTPVAATRHFETHWQLYIDGKIDLGTAVERLVEAIHQR